MKYLFLLLIMNGAFAQAPVPLDETIIKEVEKKYLEKYQHLSDKQKQEKYLIAISELCELGDFKGALQLAESGYKLKNTTLEYFDIFLTLLKQHGTKERYNEVFRDLFHDSFRIKNEEEKSTIGDILLDYMLFNSLLPSQLNPREENIFNSLLSENFTHRSSLVKAIILARKSQFKDALALLKVKDTSGLEDLLFISFLEKMNGKAISVKTPLLTTIYGNVLKIIESTPPENLVKALKGHEDIMEETPLYEAIK